MAQAQGGVGRARWTAATAAVAACGEEKRGRPARQASAGASTRRREAATPRHGLGSKPASRQHRSSSYMHPARLASR